MGVRLNELAMDVGRMNEGAWVTIGQDGTEFEVLIRSFGSQFAQEDAAARMKDARLAERKARVDDISDEARVRCILETVAYAIVLDWKGVEGNDGKPLPYTPEVLAQLMGDKATEWIGAKIMAKAQEFGVFRKTAEEGAEGN